MEQQRKLKKTKKAAKAPALKVSPKAQPKPETATVEAPARSKERTRKRSDRQILPALGISLLAAVAAVGVFVGASSLFSPTPAIDPPPTDAQLQELAQKQAGLTRSGLQTTRLTPGELQAITQSPALVAAVAAISEGEVRPIQVFDSQAADGDKVRVSANGYTEEVLLTKSPITVLLPYNRIGSNEVTITGVFDGGGGVTLGVISSGSKVPLSPLVPGSNVVLPLK